MHLDTASQKPPINVASNSPKNETHEDRALSPPGLSDRPMSAGGTDTALEDTRIGHEPKYRATLEDYILWAVIAAVLGYFMWQLRLATSVIEQSKDIEWLAAYGMNVRADLLVLTGAVLTLLGCMIVLRRIRVRFSAQARFESSRASVVADSAGVVIVVLGVVLLVIVVTHPPLFQRGVDTSGAATHSDADAEAIQRVQDRRNEILRLQANDRPDASARSAQ